MKNNNRPNYTLRRTVAAAGLSVAVAGAGAAYDGIHNAYEHKQVVANEPACEDLSPLSGEGVGQLVTRVDNAGGNTGNSAASIYMANGMKRTPENSPHLYDPHKNLLDTDTVTVEHVDPQVCLDLGGTVVQAALAAHK